MAARRASPKLPDGSALVFAVRVHEAAARQLRQPARTGRWWSQRNLPLSGHWRGARRQTIPRRHRALSARPATPGRRCSLASMSSFRWCDPAVAPQCASSPSSPTARPGATLSPTSVSRPRHPASHPPAARHFGNCRPQGSARSTPKPSRHRTMSSISASRGRRDRRRSSLRDAGLARAGGRHARGTGTPGGRARPAQRGKTPPPRRPTTPSPRRPARVNP